MRAFRRRIYRGPADLLRDLRFLTGSLASLKRAIRGGKIGAGFRERLMMVVTEVNGCRYCSSYHSVQSIKAGISDDELRGLLTGEIPEDSPREEVPALLFARHWAETDAEPDPEAEGRLVETYGDERASLIRVILKTIRAGNLMGNTLDYFLSRVSFGRLGFPDEENRRRRSAGAFRQDAVLAPVVDTVLRKQDGLSQPD